MAQHLKPNQWQKVITTCNEKGIDSAIILYLELSKKNWTISMSRVANSLDNREAEYFYSCLEGEFLSRFDTRKLSFKQVEMLIEIYISWYNKRESNKLGKPFFNL